MSAEPRSAREPAPSRTEDPAPGGQVPLSAAPAGDGQAASVPLPHHKTRRTRISGAWVAVASFAVVLLLLLIFILQNSRTVEVSYLGAHGHLPLGVAVLLAAVGGVLLTALVGAARIIQLRAAARRHRQAGARQPARQPPSPASG
jgi:uncharacterized integral membrane protein